MGETALHSFVDYLKNASPAGVASGDTAGEGNGQATLQSIAVSPDSASLESGGTQQFTATGTYSDDSTQDLSSAVTWDSCIDRLLAAVG